jgi:hypothetical protein
VDAISNSDGNIMRAVVVMGAVSFMLANLLSDVLYAVVDPRIRLRISDMPWKEVIKQLLKRLAMPCFAAWSSCFAMLFAVLARVLGFKDEDLVPRAGVDRSGRGGHGPGALAIIHPAGFWPSTRSRSL